MSYILVQADARHIPLADESVHCVVTSPPYYGLRDYGTARWEGGDPECGHIDAAYEGGRISNSSKRATSAESYKLCYRDVCGKCGARRIDAQIGLEQTPDEYVAQLVAVFRDIWRVLRPDGTVWLNLGDSYAGSGRGPTGRNGIGDQTRRQGFDSPGASVPAGLKPKDLIGIPWRVAFALQADGWWLRSDIIWAKPNPMPESVADRPTRSHEYVFLLSKSARYYFDQEAVREPVSELSVKRAQYGWNCDRPSTKNASMGGEGIHVEKMGARFVNPSGRNIRSVWQIATQPVGYAHFATYPQKLVERCVLAGCPAGGMVLDPFVGSGTTALVCEHLGRNCVGLDLNAKYLTEIAPQRLASVQPALGGCYGTR